MTTNQSTYAHSEEAKYIVSLNEKLLDENKKLRQDISELQSEHDTLENELDQREKQVTYMRGLLKNFVALDKLKQNVADEYKLLNADNQKLQSVYEQTQKNHYIVDIVYMVFISLIFFLYLIFELNTMEVMISCFLVDHSIKFYFYRKHNENVNYKEKINMFCKSRLDKIQNSTNEIERIMKGCDFLNEYIDSI